MAGFLDYQHAHVVVGSVDRYDCGVVVVFYRLYTIFSFAVPRSIIRRACAQIILPATMILSKPSRRIWLGHATGYKVLPQIQHNRAAVTSLAQQSIPLGQLFAHLLKDAIISDRHAWHVTLARLVRDGSAILRTLITLVLESLMMLKDLSLFACKFIKNLFWFALGASISLILISSIWVFNLSKSDIAAWVQAVGSLGAIFGALWIFRSETRQKHRDERERQQNMMEIVRTVSEHSTHRIQAVLKCMKSGKRNRDVEAALVSDLAVAKRNIEIAIGFEHIDARYFSVLIRAGLEVEFAKTTTANWDSMLSESDPVIGLEKCLNESKKLLVEIQELQSCR